VDFSHLLTEVGVKDPIVLNLAKLLKLFKVLRVRKLNIEIRNSTVTLDVKTYLKIFYVVLRILIYWHTVACLLWLVFQQQSVWWPAVDFAFYGLRDDKTFTEIYFRDATNQYLVLLYTAAINFSLVEIVPRTNFEILFVLSTMILSAIFNAIIFGEFAVLMDNIGRANTDF